MAGNLDPEVTESLPLTAVMSTLFSPLNNSTHAAAHVSLSLKPIHSECALGLGTWVHG